MKRIIILLMLLQAITTVFAQKEMSIREDSTDLRVAVDADENEGTIVIRSPYELTFKSITKEKDKAAEPYKIEKEGELNRYYLMFSTLPKYADRKLEIMCKGYTTIVHPILVETYRVKVYYVWDRKGTIGVSDMEKSVNEGTELFEQGQYDQAKDKLLDALDLMEASKGSPEDQANIATLLDKTAQCAEAKESAESYFNSQEWLLAKDKYQEVIKINKNDKHCSQRSLECQSRYNNTPKVIHGTVKKNGALIGGAVVMAVEYRNGKEKKPNEATRTTTDASGKFQITVLNNTTFLKCWEGMSRVKTIKITGETIHIAL